MVHDLCMGVLDLCTTKYMEVYGDFLALMPLEGHF